MKILVIGAAGMVGSAIVAEARSRGHEVTEASRHGNPALDLENTPAVIAAAQEHDATIIAVPSDRTGGPTQPTINAHARLIDAGQGLRWLIVGGAGSLEINGTPLVNTPDFPEEYAAEARTFVDILQLYRNFAADLDWTMLSPAPEIEPGAKSKHVLGTNSPVGKHVTTGNFAAALIDELETPHNSGERFTVADAS